MEFSYKVSESEFRHAWRVERKASSRSSLKTAAFWIFIMLCLLLLYRALLPNERQSVLANRQAVAQATIIDAANQNAPPAAFLENVGHFLVLAGTWILIVTFLVPMRLRYLYQRDPRMQAQFTVNVTQDFIATENSAGTSSKCSWNVYDYWCEGKGVVVLMFHSGSYSVLSLAGLSGAQQDELRGILIGALRKK